MNYLKNILLFVFIFINILLFEKIIFSQDRHSLEINIKIDSITNENIIKSIKLEIKNLLKDTMLTIIDPQLILGVKIKDYPYPVNFGHEYSYPNTLFVVDKNDKPNFGLKDGAIMIEYYDVPEMLVLPPDEIRYIEIDISMDNNLKIDNDNCSIYGLVTYGYKTEMDSIIGSSLRYKFHQYHNYLIYDTTTKINNFILDFSKEDEKNKHKKIKYDITHAIWHVFRYFVFDKIYNNY